MISVRSAVVAWLSLALVACSANGGGAGSGVTNSSATPDEPPPGRRPDVIFVPTKMEVVELMLNLAKVDSTDVVYDLGSGDGRIVITAASRRGARGVGIDIDPQRIRESVVNADSAGVAGKVEFRRADLFRTDLRPATAVMLYLLPSLNVRLRPKIFSELRPGTPVVSNTFEMGTWQADSIVVMGERHIYLWHVPATIAGTWIVDVGDGGGAINGEIQITQRYQFISGTTRLGGRTDTLTNTRLHGDSLRFTANVGGTTTSFSGTVSGASMTGTTQSGTAWRATRRGPAGSPFPLERR